jgi:hypothetical protein
MIILPVHKTIAPEKQRQLTYYGKCCTNRRTHLQNRTHRTILNICSNMRCDQNVLANQFSLIRLILAEHTFPIFDALVSVVGIDLKMQS